jgi:hypothetical protein
MSKSFDTSGIAGHNAVNHSSSVVPPSTPAATESSEEPKGPMTGKLSDILGDSGISGKKSHMILHYAFQLIRYRVDRKIHNER